MKNSKTLKETASQLLVTEYHNITLASPLAPPCPVPWLIDELWANKGQSGIASSKISYRYNHHSSWLMWVVWQNRGEKIRILQEESFKPMNNKFPSRTNECLLHPLLRVSLLVVGKRLKKEDSTIPSDFSWWSFLSTWTLIVHRTTAALWKNGMTLRSKSLAPLPSAWSGDTAEDSGATQEHQVLIILKVLLITTVHQPNAVLENRPSLFPRHY